MNDINGDGSNLSHSDSYWAMYALVQDWLDRNSLSSANLAELEHFIHKLPRSITDSSEDLKTDRRTSWLAATDAVWSYLRNEIAVLQQEIRFLYKQAEEQNQHLAISLLEDALSAANGAQSSLYIKTFAFTFAYLTAARDALSNLTALIMTHDLCDNASYILKDNGIAFDILASAAKEEANAVAAARW